MSPEQSRAARGLLDWSQSELAIRSNLSESTIRDFEKGRRVPSINNLAAVRTALEAAGVQFIPENGGGAGVRLAKRQAEGPTEATGKAGAEIARALAEKRIEEHLADANLHPAEKEARKARLIIPVPKRPK